MNKKSAVFNPSRRALLSASCGAMLLQAPFVSRGWAQTPLKIGMILQKQGAMANQGSDMALGVQIAVQEAKNSVTGRAIDLIWLDEQTPQDAVQSYQRAVEEQGAIVTLGGTSSANTLAIGASANVAKVPFVGLNSAAREPTGRLCNPFLFRVPASVPVYAAAMADILLKRGKRWYFIVASFTFGDDVRETFGKVLEDAGGQIVGVDQVPVGTTDYSSYLLKVRQSRPDVLVSGAANVGPILNQMYQMGLAGSFEVAGPAVSDTDLWSVEPAALAGIHGKTWFYSDPSNSPEEKAFIERFIATNGKAPSDRVFQGWFTTRLILKAIKESGAATGREMAAALTKVSVTEGGLPISFREWDHQLTGRLLVARARPPAGKDRQDVLDIIRSSPKQANEVDKIYGTRETSACKMPGI